jgi:peptidylprolyl isomerase
MISFLNILKRAAQLGAYACLVFGLCFALCLPAQAGVLVAALPPGNAVTDPRALLRLALPFDNDFIRQVQRNLEDIAPQVRARRWSVINGDVDKAAKILARHKDDIIASVPEARRSQATVLADKIAADLVTLKTAAETKNGEQLITPEKRAIGYHWYPRSLNGGEISLRSPSGLQQLPST